jgi:hypothetical protein
MLTFKTANYGPEDEKQSLALLCCVYKELEPLRVDKQNRGTYIELRT